MQQSRECEEEVEVRAETATGGCLRMVEVEGEQAGDEPSAVDVEKMGDRSGKL